MDLFLALTLFWFDPSPATGAAHLCRAWVRENVARVCNAGEPPPCTKLGPLVPVPCSIFSGNGMTADVPLGGVLGLCVFSMTPAGARSACAAPVTIKGAL